jgi:hypothetical protein
MMRPPYGQAECTGRAFANAVSVTHAPGVCNVTDSCGT